MTFQKTLNLLIGKVCWAVSAGEPSGSTIFLNIGEKIKLDKPINNKKLKYGLNKYDGEYVIGIFCEWRLQKKNKPITGSCEPNTPNGPLIKGLKIIVNKKITNIKLTDDCGDINIYFNDIYLKVFCNYTGNASKEYCFQDETNWELVSKNKILLEVQQGCKKVIH